MGSALLGYFRDTNTEHLGALLYCCKSKKPGMVDLARLLAFSHLLLALLFVGGVVILYTHTGPRESDVRKIAMALISVSASLIFIRLAVREVSDVIRTRR